MGDGELTKEIEKLQSEKNAQEVLNTDGMSDGGSIANNLRFMMISVPDD